MKNILTGAVEEAVQVVEDVVTEIREMFRLVSSKSFCVEWENGEKFYEEYNILRHANMTQVAGWAVCKRVITKLCSARESTKWYTPKIEISLFHRHLEMY